MASAQISESMCSAIQFVLSRDFEGRRICPEQQRRLAIHRVNVGTASVDDLVRYYRISRLIINRQWMQKGRKANCNREKDYPKRSEPKLSKAKGKHWSDKPHPPRFVPPVDTFRDKLGQNREVSHRIPVAWLSLVVDDVSGRVLRKIFFKRCPRAGKIRFRVSIPGGSPPKTKPVSGNVAM